MIGENGTPATPDWQPFGRHCGELCFESTCPVCFEAVTIPASIVLGEN